MSTSVAYLKKRLAAVGRHDLLQAAESGLVSHFAAAEEAGLIRRKEVAGTGSPNQTKKRLWALSRITRQAPPLPPKPRPEPDQSSNFARALPTGGRGRTYNFAISTKMASFNQPRWRCAVPCQCRARATSPPSRCPRPSQAAFAPCVRLRCRSSVGRASRLGRRRA